MAEHAETGPGADVAARPDRSLILAAGLLVGMSLLGLVLGTLVGAEAPAEEAGEGEELLEEIGGGWAGWGSLGVMVGTFLLGWAKTGVPLTKPVALLRRWRVDIHIWTSMVAFALALMHTVELVVLDEFEGWLSGTLATVYLAGLFVTGWWRPALVDAWGLTRWRIVHWILAIGVLLLSVMHWMVLEGSLPSL